MQNRLYDFYDEIEVTEEQITELRSRIASIKEEKISGENVYLFLHYYGTMYKEFTDAEKKRFLNTFIESIEIFKEEQQGGRLLKCDTYPLEQRNNSGDGCSDYQKLAPRRRKNEHYIKSQKRFCDQRGLVNGAC